MSTTLKFADYLAITDLKARYFRAVDTQDWASLEGIFTADASFSGFGFGLKRGSANLVSTLSKALAEVESQHQGFNPSFSVTTDGIVRGVWSMRDELHWSKTSHTLSDPNVPGMTGIAGRGFYEDEYLRIDGTWRINSSKLIRTRVEALTATGSTAYELPKRNLDPLWLV